MRIHSDVLTPADLGSALRDTGLTVEGVYLDAVETHGSRSRARRLDVKLCAKPRNGRRRQRNTGHHGAEFAWQDPIWVAATYDEYGRWLAELFDRDPHMIVAGWYDGREDFRCATKFRYFGTKADRP